MYRIFKYALPAAIITFIGLSTNLQAQTSEPESPTTINYGSSDPIVSASSFTKKNYSIKGQWFVEEKNGQNIIKFDDSFKTKSGPDLKVYLSTSSLEELESDNVEASSLKLSVLKTSKGAQSYIIPANIDLSDYKSVLIHCEAFSVLWGGFNLP